MISLKGLGNSGTVEVSKPSEPEKPSYPYGTRITLNKEVLEKLGIDVTQFKVGDTINITAKGEVNSTSVSENEYSDGISKELGIQLTEIELENPADFDAGFEEAVKEDTRIYRIPEAETQGGFKKALWNATR
jgi:hypothetical protein